MNKYEMVAMLATVMAGSGVVITLITSWFRYREKSLERRQLASPQDEQRLARMESAIEAIAIEVERISEGQRFTTRLLTERQGAPPAVAAGEPMPLPRREERYNAS